MRLTLCIDAPTRQHAMTVPLRLFEELQMKYRLLEDGRQSDRERLKELERMREDAEAWVMAKPKLQTKLVELSTEVKELRRLNREFEAERSSFEKKLEDVHDQLELVALDKEVAEEKSEQVGAQLEAAQERVAELEIELEVRRKEDGELRHCTGHARPFLV